MLQTLRQPPPYLQAKLLRVNKVAISPEQAAQMVRLANWSKSVERDLIDGAKQPLL